MSLNNLDVVDAVGTDAQDGTIILNIIDEWDWSDEHTHLISLQAKLNAYFGFVESGQIYEDYPDAKGRPLRINVIGKFSIPQIAMTFLDRASTVASQLNITVLHQVIP